MRIRTLVITATTLATLGFAGCAEEPPAEDGRTTDITEERRHKIGKANLWGSCQAEAGNLCGAKSNGNCWCDKACVEFGDCCADYLATCSDEPSTCEELGGSCMASPIDVTFGAHCANDYGLAELPGACAAFNRTCCGEPEGCAPVMCELYCQNGYALDPNGCEICACSDGPAFCGGFGNLPCPPGKACVDEPADDCDPQNGGADCGGICVDPPPPAPSCAGHCGGAADGQACYCDPICVSYGDCCGDYEAECSDRTAVSGGCAKSSGDACSTDADCATGGCGGELCYNPALGGGISTCECTTPTNVDGCGCVAGQCTWFQ